MAIVEQSTRGGVCTLQLNRAEKLNALNREMYSRLANGLNEANADDSCGVIVIKGAPGVFCAGNDLGDFASALAEGVYTIEESFLLVHAMLGCEKPIVASVDGAAVGIGTTLLFHCDLVYASHAARFHTPFSDLGVCPEFGATATFTKIMGPHRAAQMLLLGESISAADAERFGLVNQLVDSEALDDTVEKVAAKLAAKPREALRISRRLLKPDKAALLTVIENEEKEFGRLMKTEEFKNNIAKFVGKEKS